MSDQMSFSCTPTVIVWIFTFVVLLFNILFSFCFCSIPCFGFTWDRSFSSWPQGCGKIDQGKKKKLLVTTALWSRTSKNPDVSTGLLTLSFTPSLAPLTHWLAPPCSLCSGVPPRSFVHSLPFSLTPELVGKRMIRI